MQGDGVSTDIQERAREASTFLKSLANQNRFVILCALADGEKNVGALEGILGIRQPTLSQQLARLRADKLVATRRQSKQIFYRLASTEAQQVMSLVVDLFRAPASGPAGDRPAADDLSR